MSVRKESHYNINKTLLSLIGQWPHQSSLQTFLLSSNVLFGVGSQMYLQTCGLIAAWTDWDLVIECASPILIDVLCLIKFINCLFNARKMRILLERMQDAWNLILTEEQIEILQTYTHEGYKLTRTYAVAMYSATFLYMTLPHVPSLLAFIANNENETVSRALLYHVEQVVDVEKYYYLVLFHSYYGTFFLMTLPIAADSMFLVYVQHACGMFSLIGQQVENVQDGNNLDVNMHLSTRNDEVYKKITDGIVKHKDTLQFAELLGSTYSTSFLFQIGLNVAVITFSGVQAVIYLDRAEEALRFGMTGLTVSFHFLFLSLPGQKLLDHSLRVNDSVYCSNWYAISIRSRQLLDLMLMRSRRPSQITAGKIYVMTLENFGSVMQAAMSYFTVLTSMR